MSKIALSGNASGTGTLTIASPNTNTDYTLSLPTATTTLVGTDATQTLTNKTIDGSQLVAGSVTSTQMATAVQPIGVGQTWQNLTASRALSTTYTNSSGRPIMVSVVASATTNPVTLSTYIGGNKVAQGWGNTTIDSDISSTPIIVPNGVTYQFAPTVGTPSLVTWYELR